MIRDGFLKTILIPLLGLFIPLAAGLMDFRLPAGPFLASLIYFMFVLIITWQINLRLISHKRGQHSFKEGIYRKTLLLPLVASAAGCIVFWLAILAWQVVSGMYGIDFLLKCLVITGVLMVILALIYEVMFLTAEKELEGIVLKQVDHERMNAELSILKNELDPHFFFNCLTTLTQLVHIDADKAYQFIYKLSHVYKYFLVNKEKDLITLKEEMEFLDNYYYLLKVRFENSIGIEYALEQHSQEIKLLPGTLQVLVENAIKHNFFSGTEPLLVTISIVRNHLVVSNPVRPKIYAAADSTRVGLKNLKTRYRHVLNKDIIVQSSHNRFSVRLPIVKTSES